jgi:hypothetical protein
MRYNISSRNRVQTHECVNTSVALTGKIPCTVDPVDVDLLALHPAGRRLRHRFAGQLRGPAKRKKMIGK